MSNIDDTLVPDRSCTKARDITLKQGTITKRSNFYYVSDLPNDVNPEVMTTCLDDNGNEIILAIASGVMYSSSNGINWTERKTGFNKNATPDIVPYSDYIYIFDGASYPYKFDGKDGESVTGMHRAKCGCVHEGRLLSAVLDRVYFTDLDGSTPTGIGNSFQVGREEKSQIIRMIPFLGYSIIFKQNSIWALYGTDPDTEFGIKCLSPNIGLADSRAIAVGLNSLIWVYKNRMYTFGDNLLPQRLGRPLIEQVMSLSQYMDETLKGVMDNVINPAVDAITLETGSGDWSATGAGSKNINWTVYGTSLKYLCSQLFTVDGTGTSTMPYSSGTSASAITGVVNGVTGLVPSGTNDVTAISGYTDPAYSDFDGATDIFTQKVGASFILTTGYQVDKVGYVIDLNDQPSFTAKITATVYANGTATNVPSGTALASGVTEWTYNRATDPERVALTTMFSSPFTASANSGYWIVFEASETQLFIKETGKYLDLDIRGSLDFGKTGTWGGYGIKRAPLGTETWVADTDHTGYSIALILYTSPVIPAGANWVSPIIDTKCSGADISWTSWDYVNSPQNLSGWFRSASASADVTGESWTYTPALDQSNDQYASKRFYQFKLDLLKYTPIRNIEIQVNDVNTPVTHHFISDVIDIGAVTKITNFYAEYSIVYGDAPIFSTRYATTEAGITGASWTVTTLGQELTVDPSNRYWQVQISLPTQQPLIYNSVLYSSASGTAFEVYGFGIQSKTNSASTQAYYGRYGGTDSQINGIYFDGRYLFNFTNVEDASAQNKNNIVLMLPERTFEPEIYKINSGAMATLKGKLYFGGSTTGAPANNIFEFALDYSTGYADQTGNATTGSVTGEWESIDYGIDFSDKIKHFREVNVTYLDSISGEFSISYKIDDASAWSTLKTITSGETSAIKTKRVRMPRNSVGRTIKLKVSGTKNFVVHAILIKSTVFDKR